MEILPKIAPNRAKVVPYKAIICIKNVFIAAENRWEQIDAKGDGPGCLQEHTLVGYKDHLYVFGGEVGFSNGLETPLWMYNITVREPLDVKHKHRQFFLCFDISFSI